MPSERGFEAMAQAEDHRTCQHAASELPAIAGTGCAGGSEGDPAAKSHMEIIFCYPGLEAVSIYRDLPINFCCWVCCRSRRMMTEHAHSKTGIDIHPVCASVPVSSSTTAPASSSPDVRHRPQREAASGRDAWAPYRSRSARAAANIIRGMKRHPTCWKTTLWFTRTRRSGRRPTVGRSSCRWLVPSAVWLASKAWPCPRS